MSEKTELFQVQFFLINKNQTVSVKNKMLIGRTEGDVIIPDSKLSSRHCELIPKGLNLFIKDLNSTNGVYVNKLQIPANKEVRLNFGDVVRLGNEEFVFQDSETVAPASAPRGERRANPQGQNGIGAKIGSLLSFFTVPKEWKGVYLLLILLTAGSMILNLGLKAPVPLELTFLTKLYSKLVITNGIRDILLVWIICLGHAYLVSVYIKSNMVRALALVPLFVLVVNLVNFKNGPAWFVKNYVEDRHHMLEMEKNKNRKTSSIVDLKKMVELKVRYQNAYAKLDSQLLDEEKKIIEADYQVMIKTINSKIDSLKAPPQ